MFNFNLFFYFNFIFLLFLPLSGLDLLCWSSILLWHRLLGFYPLILGTLFFLWLLLFSSFQLPPYVPLVCSIYISLYFRVVILWYWNIEIASRTYLWRRYFEVWSYGEITMLRAEVPVVHKRPVPPRDGPVHQAAAASDTCRHCPPCTSRTCPSSSPSSTIHTKGQTWSVKAVCGFWPRDMGTVPEELGNIQDGVVFWRHPSLCVPVQLFEDSH